MIDRILRKHKFLPLIFLLSLSACQKKVTDSYDIIVYGGTPAGIAAAIQASRMDKKVLLVEPTNHLGGMTTNGLGQVDIGHDMAIGGIAREFHERIYQYYQKDSAWKHQEKSDYQPIEQDISNLAEGSMWTFEPHVAEKIFNTMLKENDVKVLINQRLNLNNGVTMQDKAITSIIMESGQTYQAKIFIDASYEGDLMALSGVSYTIGREDNSTYDEQHNGIQPGVRHNNLPRGIDPYIQVGNSTSGLLPGIHATPLASKGTGDKKLQAYNYRLCFTNVPENRLAFPKPDNYDSLQYEILLRMYENGYNSIPWRKSPMPNRKTDANNSGGFSTDLIGQNYNYPEANYRQREQIAQAHLNYIKGLFWTLANNSRVPENIRQTVKQWGPTKDEFTDNGGWPYQIYVREARRMIGQTVMTENHCTGRKNTSNSIGLGSYPMDSHSAQRYVTAEGDVQNEGNIHVNVPEPYPIAYTAIIPKANECTNLLVPVCLSASHVAFASIRMEPVWMILGQSAATAAALCLDLQTTIQELSYNKLKERLLADQQILNWGYTTIPEQAFNQTDGSPGLKGEYFKGDSLNELVFSQTDSLINFYFHDDAPDPRLPKDYFSICWTGQLTLTESGEYYIASNTDDGVKLWINDSLIINDWTQHGAKYNVGIVKLTAGKPYNFKMAYMDRIGKAQVSLQWKIN